MDTDKQMTREEFKKAMNDLFIFKPAREAAISFDNKMIEMYNNQNK